MLFSPCKVLLLFVWLFAGDGENLATPWQRSELLLLLSGGEPPSLCGMCGDPLSVWLPQLGGGAVWKQILLYKCTVYIDILYKHIITIFKFVHTRGEKNLLGSSNLISFNGMKKFNYFKISCMLKITSLRNVRLLFIKFAVDFWFL